MEKLLRKGSAILAAATVLFAAACNDEVSTDQDKTAIASTEAAPDKSDNTTNKPARKSGKVSAKMDAGTRGEYKKDAAGIYSNVEVQPQFPGGEGALSDYMSNSIVYPEAAIDQNVEGTVRVEFVVDEKGKVTKAAAANSSLGNGMEQAAVEVVNKMPAWTPGKVNGKNVKTKLVLPVVFRLE